MGTRESAISFLPPELSLDPIPVVDKSRRIGFDVTNQIRNTLVGLQAHQNVDMVGHAVDGDELLSLIGDDAGGVFMQFFLVFLPNQVLSPVYGEDNVNIDLGECICHGIFPFLPLFMPLLRSFNTFWG